MDRAAQREFFIDMCGICNEEITEDQAIMELLCFHTLHSHCMFHAIHEGRGITALQCTLCERGQLHADQQQEVEYGPHLPDHTNDYDHEQEDRRPRDPDQKQEIEDTFETNPEFRGDLKKLLTSSVEFNKKKTILSRSIKETKLRYRAEVELLRNSLTQLKQTIYQDIKSSQIFKDTRTAYTRKCFYRSLINRKYPYTFHNIKRVVGAKRGFRRLQNLHRFYYSPGRMLYRAFYFRLRF